MITDNLYNRRRKIKIKSNQDNHQLDLLLSFVWYDSEDGEVWKEIKGYDGYFISSHGRVLTLKRNGYKLLRQFYTGTNTIPDEQRYLAVGLSLNGKKHTEKIHCLVAEAFLTKPDGECQIHHIDRNRHNNRLDNLQYLTIAEHTKIHNEIRAAEQEKERIGATANGHTP